MGTPLPKQDIELLEGLRNDEPKAFENLFNNYWQDLYRAARRRIKDEAAAEDLVQDIFTSLWQRRYNLAINTTLEGYLHTSLKYKIIKLASSASLHEEAVQHLLYRMEQIEGSILDVLSANDLKKTMSDAISSFPKNMQDIFVLRIENYSIDEIAAALGLSKQTVKNNNTEALKRLKVIMLKQHPDLPVAVSLLFVLMKN
jgi:RNA polymerase sigma factor (sigma-70 family)